MANPRDPRAQKLPKRLWALQTRKASPRYSCTLGFGKLFAGVATCWGEMVFGRRTGWGPSHGYDCWRPSSGYAAADRRARGPTAEGRGARPMARCYKLCPGPGGAPSQALSQSVRPGKPET